MAPPLKKKRGATKRKGAQKGHQKKSLIATTNSLVHINRPIYTKLDRGCSTDMCPILLSFSNSRAIPCMAMPLVTSFNCMLAVWSWRAVRSRENSQIDYITPFHTSNFRVLDLVYKSRLNYPLVLDIKNQNVPETGFFFKIIAGFLKFFRLSFTNFPPDFRQ